MTSPPGSVAAGGARLLLAALALASVAAGAAAQDRGAASTGGRSSAAQDARASIYDNGRGAPTGARGAASQVGGGRATFAGRPPAPSGPPGLAPVGDAAPQCRAGCAGAFYACRSGEGDACGAQLGVCRTTCDASSQVSGRLVSPLPAAGLGAIEPFRRLSSAPAAAAPPQ